MKPSIIPTSLSKFAGKFSLLVFLSIPTMSIVFAEPESPNADGSETCVNGCNTSDPDEDEECEDEDDSGATSSSQSYVHNGRMDYHAWSYDFKLPDGTPGCATCRSSGRNLGKGLDTIRVKRYLNSRLESHGVSSFGRASTLAGYDCSLKWKENHLESVMSFHEAGKINTVAQLNWRNDRLAWAPISTATSAYGLTLFDVSGTPLAAFANRELAHTGAFLKANGDTIHFEIIRKADQVYGRPVAFADRNGNMTTVEYVDAQPAHGTDVTTISEYFRRTKITDPYGRELLFEYILEGTNYVVSKITHPDAEFTEYRYTSLSFYGKVIREVDHPDGSMTTETWNKNNATGFWEFAMFEATGEPGKRRKTIYISTNRGVNSAGISIATTAGLTRMVLNGEGEMTYANRTTTTGDRLVYAGGNKAFIVDISGGSRGLGKYTEVTTGASLKDNFFSTDIATLTTVEKFDQTNGNNWRKTEITDAFGRTQLYPTRDPISQSVTRIEQSDGTSKDLQRNQFNEIIQTTDRLGRVTVREFDLAGNITKETRGFGDPSASTQEWIYNAQGLVIEHRDPLYDPATPELHNTQYEYDANNFPVKIIDSADFPGGTRPETLYTYDFAGRIATITNPRAAVTTFTYDTRSRPVETLYADGSTDTITYGTDDDANLILSRTNRNGITTEYEYDLADRKIVTRMAAGLSEEITELCTFLPGTLLEATCTKRGEKTEYVYDHHNRLLSTTRYANDATALTSSTEYDVLGRRRSDTDAYGRRTFYLYDENDRLTRTVTETVPGGLNGEDNLGQVIPVPDFANDSTQTATQITREINLTNGETITLGGIHEVTYTDPRDIFLKDLTRDLTPNAPYLITDQIHDAEGQVLTSTDPRGIESLRLYDVLGRTLRSFEAITLPEERLTETDFDEASNLTERRLPRHFSETEDDGTGTQVPIRAVERFTYTGRNLRASHTIAADHPTLEATETWTYLLDGKPSTHTDARGNLARQYWRACCGRLQASVDRDGTSTQISNTDHEGNATHTATVSAPPVSNYSNPVDADTLQETTTRFDGLNRPTHTTRWLVPLGTVDESARVSLGDPTGVPIAGLDGIPATDGLTTSYVYDEDLTDGQGIDLTYAAQLAVLATRGTAFSADVNGYATAITNPAGETSVIIQDGLGRTVMTINPEGDTQTIRHDEVLPAATLAPAHLTDIPLPGDLLVTTSTDALGHETIKFTDAAGRTILIQDAAGNLAGMAYDASSNRTISRDPNGLGENCEFDNLNRETACADLQEQSETTSRTKTYNTHNSLLTSTDAEGEITENTYDTRDRLASSEDANNITTSYGYDENNNLRTLTDGEGNTRAWFYDARNLNIAKQNSGATPPATGDTSAPSAAAPTASATPDVVTYSYDALARLTLKTAQDSSTVTHIYDLASRLIQRDYSDSTTDTFEYDAASRLTQSTKGRYGVTTNHTYLPDSQPASETSTFDSRTYNLTRTYDAANRPVTHTFGDGKIQTWSYDTRNLVTSSSYESENILTQSHDPARRLTQQAFGNGLTHAITYSRLDNLRGTDIVYDGSQVIETLSMAYSYSADKQVTAETFPNASLLAATGFAAAYDPGNRVTAYTRSGGLQPPDQTWIYDDNGNWTSNTLAGQPDNRTHNADNEITTGATSYDARGNMTEDADGNEYHYDLDNRIFKIEMHQGASVEFLYDATSRRVQRKEGSTKTAYLWWGDQECSEHKHQAGQATIQNDLWAHPTALNTIIARAVDGSKFDIQWYHKNYLDHVYAVSDDSGSILEHYRYSAFGIVEFYNPTGQPIAGSQIANPVLWNSRRYDEATKLHYYKYRHYSPKLGRWPSRDPIGERGGVNLYAFSGNNGINRWDYLGLQFEEEQEDFGPKWGEKPEVPLPPLDPNAGIPPAQNNWWPDNLSSDTEWSSIATADVAYEIDLLCLACCTNTTSLLFSSKCQEAISTFMAEGVSFDREVQGHAIGFGSTPMDTEFEAASNGLNNADANIPHCYSRAEIGINFNYDTIIVNPIFNGPEI